MIDHSTIQRILDTAEITEVVGDFVTLRKRGVNLIGLCPFHNEKTPSFNVNPARGIFKCFGCGKGGSPVNFIMEHEHLSYVDALKWLARKYHIEVVEKEETPEEVLQRNDRDSQIIVSGYAQKYFTDQLWESQAGKIIGLAYFHERGFRDEIIRKFGLGYSPDGKDPFTQKAISDGYKMEYLEKTGLTIKRDDWIRDRFAGRVMFPIHDISGRVIAFGGRTLSQDKTIAKYLNSPESDIYVKSKIVYGISLAKRAIIQEDKCYMVEGYTDVIAMHQAGVENVVASSGTSLTVDQIRLIKRFTSNMTIIYDGDAAGIKASLRGIDLVLEQGMNVKVLQLPKDEDPDSFSKSLSYTQLREYIQTNETDFIKFKTSILLPDTGNDPIARSKLITEIVSTISIIPNEITRTEYLRECSRMLKVDEAVLYHEIGRLKRKEVEKSTAATIPLPGTPPPVARPKVPESANPHAIEERELVRVLLKYGNHMLYESVDEKSGEKYSESVAEFILAELEHDNLSSSDEIITTIFEEYKMRMDPGFNADQYFSNHPNPSVSDFISDVLSERNPISPFWERGGSHVEREEDLLTLVVPKILAEYKLVVIRARKELIIKEIEQRAGEDLEATLQLQMEFQRLKKVENLLCKNLGNRTIIPKK